MAGNLTLNDLQTIWNLIKTSYVPLFAAEHPHPIYLFCCCRLPQNLMFECLNFSPNYRIPEWWWVNKVIVGALLKCFSPLIADCVLTPTL